MLAAMITVLALVALCMLVHYEVLRLVSDSLPRMTVQPRLRILAIVFAAFAAHSIEVWIYGIGYYVFVHILELGSFGGGYSFTFIDYVYFSSITYTSLGLGDIVPLDGVRLIAGVESLNGLILIAWTGSFTYLAMEKLWPLHTTARRADRHKKSQSKPDDDPPSR